MLYALQHIAIACIIYYNYCNCI